MTLHLEGMGVLGCYLAHRLDADGIDFTWHDTNEAITAWRACTGAIFPTGHAEDMLAMDVWADHFEQDRLARFRSHMEAAAYVFSTKRPPHKGRDEFVPLAPGVNLLARPSLHLNAQQWVPWTRALYARKRWEPAPIRVNDWPSGKQTVVTHGFGARLERVMWGWTVPVRVHTTTDLGEQRPCIYFRRGRFTMAYAYPIPNTNTWYAGSSLISQRVPRSLDVWAKFKRWRSDFIELGGGWVTDVEVAGNAIEGWRPVPSPEDRELVRRLPSGALAVRPLWHSGVRHAPLVYRALRASL